MQQEKSSTGDFFADPSPLGDSIRRRLREVLGQRRQAVLAEIAGELPQNVSRYLRDRTPSVEFLARLAAHEKLSLDWLILGRGAMRIGEPDLAGIPFERLSAEYQSRIAAMMRQMQRAIEGGRARSDDRRRPKPSGAHGWVELVDAEGVPHNWPGSYAPLIGRIAAGRGIDTTEAESYPAGLAAQYVRVDGAPPRAFAVRVEGDSMSLAYNDGDVVIADGGRPARSGVCVALVRRDGTREALLKRLRVAGAMAHLESLNRRHPTVDVPAENVEAFAIWRHITKAELKGRNDELGEGR